MKDGRNACVVRDAETHRRRLFINAAASPDPTTTNHQQRAARTPSLERALNLSGVVMAVAQEEGTPSTAVADESEVDEESSTDRCVHACVRGWVVDSSS